LAANRWNTLDIYKTLHLGEELDAWSQYEQYKFNFISIINTAGYILEFTWCQDLILIMTTTMVYKIQYSITLEELGIF
jgi:hypothetical protein